MKRLISILTIVCMILAVGCFSATAVLETGENSTTAEAPIQESAYNAYMQVSEDFITTHDGSNSVTVYPDYYGGSYINDDGKLVIFVPEDTITVATSSLSELEDESYVIEPVSYSYNTLKDVMNQLNDYFLHEDDEVSNNINRFGIYDDQNRIVVSLFDASPEKIVEFKETVCDSPVIIFEENQNVINNEA